MPSITLINTVANSESSKQQGNLRVTVATNILSLFTEYADKKGITADKKGLAVSGKIIETQLMAYISRISLVR